MGNRLLARIVIACILTISGAARAVTEGPWAIGLREGGQGFYLTSPDQLFQLNFLGYGQFLGGIFSREYENTADRPDYPVGFQVRRARLATLVTLYRNYELFVEFGTPNYRPIAGAGAPAAAPATRGTDFGLVEARVTARLLEDAFQLRVGKFVGPFSAENARSSRNLDTIERSTLLNSMQTFPALDTQIGAMIFGRLAEGIVNYYFGIFNGNADSFGTPPDENGEKEFQFKLVFVPAPTMTLGIAWETEYSGTRPFSLVDHAYLPLVTGVAGGRRHGLELDVAGEWNWFSFAVEGIYFTFPDLTATASALRDIYGATLQLGWQLAGDKTYGLQMITRGEWTHVNLLGNHDLYSAILGFNIFINANVRNQVNYIAEIPNAGRGQHILFNELQIKF